MSQIKSDTCFEDFIGTYNDIKIAQNPPSENFTAHSLLRYGILYTCRNKFLKFEATNLTDHLEEKCSYYLLENNRNVSTI